MIESKRERIANHSVEIDDSIISVFKRMDAENVRLLCVMENGIYRGIVSAGDIQRAIIGNHSLETQIGDILREEIRVAREGDDFETIKAMMLEFRTEFMPVLDSGGRLVDVIFWADAFVGGRQALDQLGLPVVVMAGGKGTRLKPFSNIFPKPLFPLGERTIIEEIMDRFRHFGCERFYLSVNYKADFIRSYFESLDENPYLLNYFQEDQPLGTAGSLHLIRDQISEPFFVTNCDIIIDTDYAEIVRYHRDHDNEITLVAALKNIRIPYGTVESGEGGQLLDFQEKPELRYLVNAGMYLLEPDLLDEVPEGEFFHITDLIESVRGRDGRVGVFPVSEKSWCDIGEWDEYRRTLAILSPTQD